MAQSEYEKQQIRQMVQRAVQHASAGTTDWTNEIYRLPVERYSPRSWEEEMNAIFRRLPLMLGLSTELRGTGAYKALKVLDVPVLMVRGEDGVLRAFINACRHRGRAVTQAHEENGKARSFVCPYHAWRFGIDGQLLSVADPRKFGEVDRSRYPLVQLPCEERLGFVWVCITPGLPFNLDHYLGGMQDELRCLEADQ